MSLRSYGLLLMVFLPFLRVKKHNVWLILARRMMSLFLVEEVRNSMPLPIGDLWLRLQQEIYNAILMTNVF